MEKHKTFCSICSAFCGFEADVENNKITALHPDKAHPMSQGFSCSKGRHFHYLLDAQSRVTHCQKRSDSDWQQVDKQAALDQIAERIKPIMEQHGPESIAVYCGNGVTFKAITMPSVHAFMGGLGSHQIYSSLTIDQPAKIHSISRHGVWAAGGHSFESAGVLMLIGNNPLVSGLQAPGSIPGWNPGRLKLARARGLKLIVVDPRLTETARQADLYLPIRPGTDAVFLCGVINWIVRNNLEDKIFCDQFTENLNALRDLVADYDLSKTAAITGLEKGLIQQSAELFARQGRGTVSSATGPDMARHANLTEHLIYSINTLCGRHNRAGDKVTTSLLTPEVPPIEGVVPWDFLPDTLNPMKNTQRSRLSGANQLFLEMPTATLADEILTPGKGQIKALLVIGGNPILSIPDQDKTRRALSSLDLCVCIDGRASDTAEFADYLLPASYGLERVEMTSFNDTFWDQPYHQISQPVVNPPDDACPEYHYLTALAKRLNTKMNYAGGAINTGSPPDEISLLELIYPEGSTKVSIKDIASHPDGKIYEQYAAMEVLPAFEGMEDRLRFMPEGVAEEFALLKADLANLTEQDGYLLICRRNPHIYNSMCHEFPQAPADNPAWLHPEDISAAGLQAGQQVVVKSASGEIKARIEEDAGMRRGVVSMSHGFGGKNGFPVARLLTLEGSTDKHTQMPQMTAIPVQIQGL
ncbi:MAG: molybdopterin-dependent oxidoreductase [Halieaceae bacterium]|jgi:anaerobic selenocysteine-containing dehydrogenase|nr:molybdopterin-dependent oxidoreductase [Halieaceae bacterium]